MKLSFITLSLAALLLAGCASISEPKLLAPLTKVTLVSVSANDKLYFPGDTPPKASLVDMAMNSATNDGKSNSSVNKLLEKTDVFVAKGEELLAAALSANKGSSLIPKETLFASQAYSKAADDKIVGGAMLRPAGYKFVNLDAALAGQLGKELGVNGVITANFLFQKVMAMGMMGTGTLGAQTTLSIAAYDAANKLVFMKQYVGVSKSNTGIALNVYDPVLYEPVMNEATKVAVDKFAADLAAK